MTSRPSSRSTTRTSTPSSHRQRAAGCADPLPNWSSGDECLTLVVLGVALSVVVLGVIGFLVLVAATACGQRTIAARRAAKKVNGQTGRR